MIKRAHILDTYYGEGQLDTQAPDWPGFDALYLKISHGGFGYVQDKSGGIGINTRQIASQARDFRAFGTYHYPSRPDRVNWKVQAETYINQLDALDKMGVTVNFDVLDMEKTHIVDPDGTFPASIGWAMLEFYKYVVERTQRPFFLYSNPYTYRDCFLAYNHTWVRGLPWIVAQYPFRGWVDGLDNEAIEGKRDPVIYPLSVRGWNAWQYSDKYPAGQWFPDSAAADVNVWNGSVEEMLSFLGTRTLPPTDPTDPTDPTGPTDPVKPGFFARIKNCMEGK